MAETQKTEEWEGPPLDQEEEEEADISETLKPEASASEDSSTKTLNNSDNGERKESLPNGEEDKENFDKASGQSRAEKPSESAKQQQEPPTTRGRSKSRPRPEPARRRSTNKPSKMSGEQNDDGNASTTAVSSSEKSRPLPAVYEDNDAANKGQLVKRNRRRNRKSGYESSTTEDMPLKERQYPPQQQMQPQPQAAPAKKSDAIKLRLDINLEIEVELKARIHGDLTLSLLS